MNRFHFGEWNEININLPSFGGWIFILGIDDCSLDGVIFSFAASIRLL